MTVGSACLPACLPRACRGKARRGRLEGRGSLGDWGGHRKNSTDARLSKAQTHMRSLTSFLNNSSIISNIIVCSHSATEERSRTLLKRQIYTRWLEDNCRVKVAVLPCLVGRP